MPCSVRKPVVRSSNLAFGISSKGRNAKLTDCLGFPKLGPHLAYIFAHLLMSDVYVILFVFHFNENLYNEEIMGGKLMYTCMGHNKIPMPRTAIMVSADQHINYSPGRLEWVTTVIAHVHVCHHHTRWFKLNSPLHLSEAETLAGPFSSTVCPGRLRIRTRKS